MFHEAVGWPWCMEREITWPQRSETMGLRGQRHRNMTVAIIPSLMHRIPFRLAACRPNGFGPPHRYRRRAIVDPVTRSQDTGRRNRASGIFPVFCRVEDPIIRGRSAETAGFLDGRGESYGWKRLGEGMGPVGDR